MPRMGKTEEDWSELKLGFLKTVQPNSFWKFISAVCNFKNNAQKTFLLEEVSHDEAKILPRRERPLLAGNQKTYLSRISDFVISL